MNEIKKDASGAELTRTATYQFTLYSVGNFAGKLVIVARPGREPKPNIATDVIRGTKVGTVAVGEREIEHGKAVSVRVHLANASTPDLAGAYEAAKTALTERYPGVEIVHQA